MEEFTLWSVMVLIERYVWECIWCTVMVLIERCVLCFVWIAQLEMGIVEGYVVVFGVDCVVGDGDC